MKLLLAEPAESDLEAIGDWIARDNPVRALTFLAELRAACAVIGALPEACPLVPRYEHHGIRRKIHGDYLIFYRVGEDAVTIIHILHGARDVEDILFGP